MKKKLLIPIISSIFLLFIITACNRKGTCTVRCVCDYAGYQQTTSYTPGEELTKDECEETADYYDDSNCSCDYELD